MFRVAHIRMGQARNEPHSFVLNSNSEKICMYVLLHNTRHFNLTVCFQNWSLQLTLKIT